MFFFCLRHIIGKVYGFDVTETETLPRGRKWGNFPTDIKNFASP